MIVRSGWSSSICWSLTRRTMSPARRPAAAPGDPGRAAVICTPGGVAAALAAAAFDDLVSDLADRVAGDSEAEPLRALLADDERVHTDDLTRGRPDERPAGVPRADGRVGLDEVLEEQVARGLARQGGAPGRGARAGRRGCGP